MSLTAYFVLLNRACLERKVAPLLADVSAGRTDEAILVLKTQLPVVAANLDTAPEIFFQYRVHLAIETLEGRLAEAFVNELSPAITDPRKALEHNIDTHVRGGLALSLCADTPGSDVSPAIGFWRRFSWIIRQASPTAADVADHDNPELIEFTHTGIFQEPEMFLQTSCLEKIASEIRPVFETLSTLPESEKTISSLQQFQSLIVAPLRDPELVLLKGYV